MNDPSDPKIVRIHSGPPGPRDHLAAIWAALAGLFGFWVIFFGLSIFALVFFGTGVEEFSSDEARDRWMQSNAEQVVWNLVWSVYALKMGSAFLILLAVLNVFRRADPRLITTYFVLGYVLLGMFISEARMSFVWVGSSGVALVSLAFYLWSARKNAGAYQ